MSVTWDISFQMTTAAISNNYLTCLETAAGDGVTTRSTVSKAAGKWFNRFSIIIPGGDPGLGFCNATKPVGTPGLHTSLNSLGYFADGNIWSNAAPQLAIGAYGTGSLVDMALDMVNNKVWFRVNSGLWNGSATDNPATNTGGFSLTTLGLNPGPYYVAAESRGSTVTADFGILPADAPLGFAAWDPDGAAGFILNDDKNQLIYTAEVTTFSVPARIGA